MVKSSQSVKEKLCCSQKSDVEASQQRNNSENRDDYELPDRILHPEEYDEETSAKPTGMNSMKQLFFKLLK